jgi:hypothetical protein
MLRSEGSGGAGSSSGARSSRPGLRKAGRRGLGEEDRIEGSPHEGEDTGDVDLEQEVEDPGPDGREEHQPGSGSLIPAGQEFDGHAVDTPWTR